MNRTFSRVLWVIAGVLLVIVGVGCLCSPAATLAGLTLYLGIAMLVSGVVDLLVYAAVGRYMVASGWFLVDGILTILLSLIMLCDRWFTALTIPLIFGIWLMCSGIHKLVQSLELRRLGIRGWGWFLALGIVMTAAGFLSFLDPLTAMVAITVLVGVFLILQGVASILRGCFFHRFWL